MTTNDLARILLRAADIAEKDLADPKRDRAHIASGQYTHQEFAAYRLLRWISDGANEVRAEDVFGAKLP